MSKDPQCLCKEQWTKPRTPKSHIKSISSLGGVQCKEAHAMCLLFPTTQLKWNNFNYWNFIVLGCDFEFFGGYRQLYCTQPHAAALVINTTEWIQCQVTPTGREQVKDKHPSREQTKLSPNSHVLTVTGSHRVIM